MVSNDAASRLSARARPAGADRSTPERPRGLSRRRALTLPPAIAALVTLGGCGILGGSAQAQAYDTDATHREVPLEDVPGAPDAAAACAALSESLLRFRLGEEPGGNVLNCPVGTALAVALLYAGSASPADGVDALLGVATDAGAGADADHVRDLTWSALQNALLPKDPSDAQLDNFNPEQIPDTPLLHIANRVLLVGDNPAVEQSYLDAARQWYAATTEHATRGRAKAALDAWAKRHTGGLIESSGIEITGNTRLVLQNALLFAAGWASPFTADDTTGDDFTLSDGTTATAQFMHDKRLLPYAQGEGWRAVRLQYAEGSGSTVMDVILPDSGTTPAQLPEGTWTAASAALDAVAYEQRREVRLALPTLDLQPGAVDLLAFLEAQGITLDSLEHIGEDLVVDQAVQQVRLIVKEEGTVAGALTEVSVTELAAAPEEDESITFTVDHPYVVRVFDQLTGLVLIEGIVMDPSPQGQ
ncbi:serpin family protein [Actinomyces ruminicola]|uniref:serpin family protein n=1 Tax=Actinomyces ruminicola TaxID=332524 RepID=UPI0011CAC147|nr:serpin family protein [Actinomyces ruminicola]